MPSPPITPHNVLITGGAGFIGSHLADLLIEAGCRVEVLDDLSTGSITNIDHLRGNERFRFTFGTVREPRDLAEAVDRADAVYHLAAAVGVRLIVERPVHTIETNIAGTENVLQACARKGKRVLIASTSEVYGKSPKLPFAEEDDVVLGASRRPRWAYACSKLIDEFLALAYAREKKLPVVVARLFNTVGPRQTGRYGMVIPRFVAQAKAGEPLTVYGDGSQSRTFCHVADAVGALAGLLETPGAMGRVFNVGGMEEITIMDLARLIVARTDSRSEIQTIPFEEAYDEDFEDMQRRKPDMTRIAELIGYAPQRGIEDIVDDVAGVV
ncbi:MAG: GDP-mannose 4,6-dehydratase [Sumerlaeia bacterium]